MAQAKIQNSDIAETISIAKGGTGQTTANTALNTFLPSQTGNSGKFLTTNATDSSWGTPATTSAGGSTTQVQFNDGGTAFGGDSAFTWNKTNNVLTLTVSSDNPPLQIITGGNNLVDVGAIKLWSGANNSTEKLLSAGNGVVFDENVAIYSQGYVDVVPQGAIAYDAHIIRENSNGFNAGRAGSSSSSATDTAGFRSTQTFNDAKFFQFLADFNATTGSGMIIMGTGSTNTDIYNKHLLIWGDTAANANKAISIGNGTSFTETAYITNDGAANFSSIVSNGKVRLKGYTVSTLPAGTQGDTAYVTDALAPTFLATIVGGGAVVTPVFYNGTNWVGY